MKKLTLVNLICVNLAWSSVADAAPGVTLFNVPIGTCHATNLVRALIRVIFLDGPSAARQALDAIPGDFFDIAARNRTLAATLATAADQKSSTALTGTIDAVRDINTAVTKLQNDIKKVDTGWVNKNGNSNSGLAQMRRL